MLTATTDEFGDIFKQNHHQLEQYVPSSLASHTHICREGSIPLLFQQNVYISVIV